MKKKIFKSTALVLILLVVSFIRPLHALSIIGEGAEAFPPYIGQKAEYRFYFLIEKRIKVHETISLLFPPGFEYQEPKEIPGPEIIQKPKVKKFVDGSIEYKFYSTLDLDPSKEGYDHIRITFPSYLGFTNPAQPGLYTIKIRTQAEPVWVPIGEMVITHPNPPGVIVSEAGKKGTNGWFVEMPEIWLESIDYSFDVVYCINKINIQNPSGIGKAIQVNTGNNKAKQRIVDVYYTVFSKDGKISDWDILTYYIDQAPPFFYLNCADTFQTISGEFLLQGAIQEETINNRGTYQVFSDHVSSIKINQKSIEFNQTTNQFSTNLILQPGENTFQIEVVDQAGNSTKKEITIIRNME